ncbi:CAP-associated domain-containing protein [Marinicrinis sediminis]|uniref:CAP-associated domain-containing protein n=1 Tax=Marinicrinis sediminis TaxID=1652465 RepID=A0ABW5R9B3_9BACL
MKKKLLLFVLVFVVGLSAIPVYSNEGTFSDTGRHWSNETLLWAKNREMVSGYPDGTFKPNQQVSEAEFVTLLYRALGLTPQKSSQSHWADPYYDIAEDLHYPYPGIQQTSVRKRSLNREEVAEILAWADGQPLTDDKAIQYILDQGYSVGKTSATVKGFQGSDSLTRAESVQFIKNTLDAGMSKLTALKANALPDDVMKTIVKENAINGITIGDTQEYVLETWGPPARKDPSKYGFTWYVYNQSYLDFAMIGMQNDKVVALFTNADNWTTARELSTTDQERSVKILYGNPIDSILKGNTYFMLNHAPEEAAVYKEGGQYVTFYYDTHENGRIMGVQFMDEKIEDKLSSFYGQGSSQLEIAYEKQIFDLVNVERVERGLPAFQYDTKAQQSSRKHSTDMGEEDYFDHMNLKGESPFDRMKAEGIRYRLAAENIAAGQSDAIYAHMDWMNSLGHRQNLLGKTTRLGVGVQFISGSDYKVYYTQNFYTPL